MKFLALAYGDEKDWVALSEDRRVAALAQDDVLRARGDYVAIAGEPTVVRSWDGPPVTSEGPFVSGAAPLAGIGLIEADSLEDAVRLVSGTPCAVARGAVEVRPLIEP